MPIVESGITLDFPDNNFFRFQDCPGYTKIQHNFKEMDFCWYDSINDELYIIELKDWGNGSLLEENNPSFTSEMINDKQKGISNHRIHELFKKTLDSTSMFLSILLNKPYSLNIKGCFSFNITNNTTIKLLSIINWTNPDTSYISNIHSAYKAHFKPYATLFGIKTFVVMTKNQAASNYPWIT